MLRKLMVRVYGKYVALQKVWMKYRYLRSKSIAFANIKPCDEYGLDLISIAFNNATVIRHQIRLVRKYLQEPFVLHVADNSSDDNEGLKIEALCQSAGVGYTRLPANPFSSVHGSMSHGLAIEWVVRNYLRPRGSRYFGLLDHDVFPVKPTTILEFLRNQPFYGHAQERGGAWYLWPGFCFFDRRYFKLEDMNFMPSEKLCLDTGGGNWKLFVKHNRGRAVFPTHSYVKVCAGAEVQNSSIELFGDWIHTFNASGWMRVADGRMQVIDEFLETY